jgi:plastocyanin
VKIQTRLIIGMVGVLLTLVLASYLLARAGKKGANKYVCSEANPASQCNASTLCGSASDPCIVSLKRKGANSASVMPSTSDAKANAPFCVKVGTTVTWESTSKNTGFILDFGPTSPFDTPGAIIGGSDRPISVVAKRPGCYKFSLGACTPGTMYGMCGSVDSEIIVTNAGN